MQGIARGPLGVTREAAGAFARQAGLRGVRKIMVEHIVRLLVPSQGVVLPPVRPAPAWAFGNAGQRLNHAVAFFSRDRANPAATGQGAVALGEETSCLFFEMPLDKSGESTEAFLSPLPAGGVAP